MAIIETDAADAVAAVASAWAAFEPGFKRPLQMQRRELPQDGWTERYSFLLTASVVPLCINNLRREFCWCFRGVHERSTNVRERTDHVSTNA
jgi:hypothetical protein